MKEQLKRPRATLSANMKPSAADRTLREAFEAEKAGDLATAVRRFKQVARFDSNIALSKSSPNLDPQTAYEMMDDALKAEKSGDVSTATRLYKRVVRSISNIARSTLGTIYSNEMNPPEVSKAIYWYKSGVKNGHAWCAWNLAMQYAKMGRKRGYLHWLAVAEEMGDEDAPVELADNFWWNKNNSKFVRTETRRRTSPRAKRRRA
jgi:TPR repeat protein